MSQNMHGKLFAVVSFGYSTKLIMPLEDATQMLALFKNTSLLTGYGDSQAIEPFGIGGSDSTVSLELINELAINKIKVKNTIGG